MPLFRTILLFLAVFNLAGANAEPTYLRGSAIGAAGLKVELIAYSDFISNTRVLLAEGKIGQNSIFEIRPILNSTTFVYLKIGQQQGEIIIEPGKNYNFRIAGILDKSLRNQNIAPFQIPALQIEIVNPWRFELNGLVREFYFFHDDFLTKHAMALLRQRDGKLVKEYITGLYNLFPGIDNAWFNNMLAYKIASIEMMAKVLGREALAGKFILNREILYNHLVYMDFFNQFFEKYLVASRIFDRNELVEAMESAEPYRATMALLAKDTLLNDKRLRELVLLKGMGELSSVPGFSKNSIIKLLGEVRTKSGFPEHQLIAGNLIALLQRN